MKNLARSALTELLRQADRKTAGIAKKEPCLTARHLETYHKLRSLTEKEEFDASMKHAQITGAIRLTWPPGNRDGFLERIELVDAEKLASLLDTQTASAVINTAAEQLRDKQASFPVLEDVVARWKSLAKVRGSGPTDALDWIDACKAIEWCRTAVTEGRLETPLRDASALIFRDSKRLEKLVAELDILLCGSVDASLRDSNQVYQELGLYKEPQPARLAGNVVIRRSRVTALLDVPYTALPAEDVLALRSAPSRVITIENLTTFSVQARASALTDDLLIYTGGMPSPSWCAMYDRLLASLPTAVPIFHWGDVDEGGFRIAAFIAQLTQVRDRKLNAWKMKPSEVPMSQRRDASDRTIDRMRQFAEIAGWHDIAEEVFQKRFIAEQEG